jgi:hypothetical protein
MNRAEAAMTRDDARRREQERQQALLQALWRTSPDAALQPWLQATAVERAARGLATYRANAGAHAERSLAAAFPTVQALIGDEAFAALARAVWRAHPPERGDMACFGAALPAFLAADGGLPDLPYLLDSARLDWALAQAEAAPDTALDAPSLALLGSVDADRLQARLAPGFAVLRSAYPVVSIWQAHQPVGDAAQALATAQQALREGRGETALVWRQGWKARAEALNDEADARWCEALLQPLSFAAGLDRAGASFDIEHWLPRALQQGWLLGVIERAV